MIRKSDDFMAILNGFFNRLHESGAVLFPDCYDAVCESANRLLSHPDAHYMPDYKLTELMANLVNVAASISSEGWLSPEESLQQFRSCSGLDSQLALEFLANARMERARYEPIMLAERFESPRSERNAILRMRLKRMLAARQTYDPLPGSFVRAIRIAGQRAIQAPCFATYRIGPMMQFFADMITQADQIADTTYDEFAGIAALNHVLREEGNLWKLYRHKAPRFSAKPGDPLHEGVFTNRATMLYIPDHPDRPTLH